jgi:hypothetical protein
MQHELRTLVQWPGPQHRRRRRCRHRRSSPTPPLSCCCAACRGCWPRRGRHDHLSRHRGPLECLSDLLPWHRPGPSPACSSYSSCASCLSCGLHPPHQPHKQSRLLQGSPQARLKNARRVRSGARQKDGHCKHRAFDAPHQRRPFKCEGCVYLASVMDEAQLCQRYSDQRMCLSRGW